MTLEQAKKLYPQVKRYRTTGYIPQDSILRDMARETFLRISVGNLERVIQDVYRVLADEYMKSK